MSLLATVTVVTFENPWIAWGENVFLFFMLIVLPGFVFGYQPRPRRPRT